MRKLRESEDFVPDDQGVYEVLGEGDDFGLLDSVLILLDLLPKEVVELLDQNKSGLEQF